jgi:hypothetical protein
MTRAHSYRGLLAAAAVGAFTLIGARAAYADAPKVGEAAARPPDSAIDRAGGEAATHFKRGLQLFDEGDYTLALVEFERAYQLAPNYRALYNIALVDLQLGRYANAVRTLESYLHDGGDGISTARRAEVSKTLSDLKFRTATVEITLSPRTDDVTLDGKTVEKARLRGPLLIDAGEHTLRAAATGYNPQERTVTLAGGDHASVSLELVGTGVGTPVAPAPVARTHGVFWPGFAVTGVLAASAVVSGVIMLDARSRLQTLQNTPGSDASERGSASSRANGAALASDILTGLAVVAGGVSIYLSLGSDRSPSVAIGPDKVLLSGRF